MFLVIGIATNINNEPRTSDTITSLSYLPSWFSTPSLLSVPVPRQPHALMAMDTTCNHDISFDNNIGGVGSETEDRERKGPVRINIFFFITACGFGVIDSFLMISKLEQEQSL